MCKAQSKDVDGRCDGDEMSARDQRVGTSHSDSVKEDVSLEYITVSPSKDSTMQYKGACNGVV